jgi:pimeloyl-ACP methyl ester carboxylesterase
MTRVSIGMGRYGAHLEWDHVWTDQRAVANVPIIYSHGSGQTALNLILNVAARSMFKQLAKYGPVSVADLGGQNWGNDDGQAKIGAVTDQLVAEHGADDVPAIVVCVSMGNATGMGHALGNPDRVAAIASVSPLIDFASIIPLGYGDDLDAAYPPAYDDETDGPTHSPIQFATDLEDDLPIHIWTGATDPLALPDRAQAFVALRPQTDLDIVTGGHDDTAFYNALPGVIEFVAAHA